MTNRFFHLTAALAVAGAITACTGDATAPTGTLDVPLTAVGASGATYHLPPGARLLLASDDEQISIGQFLPVDDGSGPSLSVELPVGSYFAALYGPDGRQTTWQLTRVSPAGVTALVEGTLQPLPGVVIADGVTTTLALRFTVQGEPPISFSHGTLDVQVIVDEVGAPVTEVTITSPAHAVSSLNTTAETPAALLERLPAPSASGQQISVTARATGPWKAHAADAACAPAEITIRGTGDAGLVDLLAEAAPADTSSICVFQDAPGAATVFLTGTSFGPARTPLLSDLGPEAYFTSISVLASIQADVFQDFTLRLSELASPPASGMFVDVGVSTFVDGVFATWVELGTSAPSDVTVTGRAVFGQ